MTRRAERIGLLLAVALAGAVAQDKTHDQKVAEVRRLIAAEPYISAFGVLHNAEHERLSDAQLEQEISRRKQESSSLERPMIEAQQAYHNYQAELARQGKTQDPTGKLKQLETASLAAYARHCDAGIALIELQQEKLVRTDPDRFVEVERSVQGSIAGTIHANEALRKLAERANQGDPEARRQLGLPPVARPRTATPTMRVLPAPPEPAGSRTASPPEVKYPEIYGPSMDAQVIQAVEARAISKLPMELRVGVSPEMQRLFVYGGYESLSPEYQRHLRRIITDIKLSGQQSGQSLNQQFERAFQLVRRVSVSTRLTNQTRAGGLEGAAFLLLDVTQRITDFTYDYQRRKRWEAAFRAVAAEIPRGRQEPVLFIEQMRRNQSDMIQWLETESVRGYRSGSGPCPVEGTEDLANVRRSPVPGYWRFYRLTRAQVTGTGEGASAPTEAEAYQAGFEMGKLAAGLKLTREMMKVTYAKYNRDPKTRDAFKKGYRAGSGGKEFP